MQEALRRRAIVMCGVVVSLLFACTVTSFAQSLGDIARQERERKNDQSQPKTHVYTNDDLQKPHILVPEDQARALSARTWIGLTPIPAVQASEHSVPALPAAIPIPPSPASRRTALIASSPARVETPSTDLPVTLSRPPTVLVSSPTGWKTVRLGTAKDQIALSNIVTRKAVPEPARQPKANSSQANRVRVARGDSLWKLAERHLGGGARWREVAEPQSAALESRPHSLRRLDLPAHRWVAQCKTHCGSIRRQLVERRPCRVRQRTGLQLYRRRESSASIRGSHPPRRHVGSPADLRHRPLIAAQSENRNCRLSDSGLGFFKSREDAEELTDVRHVQQRSYLWIHSGERQLLMSLL